MAQFTKKVAINAYRFMPEELNEWEKEYPEDIIKEELQMDIYRADVGEDGNLHIKYYAYEEGKQYVELRPGEWIVSPEMRVYTDEEFKAFATPVA